jgi:phosphoadenosine phosphosulfate reductase
MENSLKADIVSLTAKLKELDLVQAIALLASSYPGAVTFSSSFSVEDQTITHAILENKIAVSVFTLDTGRVFPETYSVWSATNDRYNTKLQSYNPDYAGLQTYLNEKGPNAFYESIDNRKECCFIRKIEPLNRALKGNKIWITGLRGEHSASRQELEMLEWDEGHQLIKFHPILHWTTEEVRAYITKNNVPYNTLQDKGFVSIGCLPCTRAIKEGEDFRAGRWWWEDDSKKECGLHEDHK